MRFGNAFYNKLLLKREKHKEYRDQYFKAFGYFINFPIKNENDVLHRKLSTYGDLFLS